ncbi:NADPH-dependent oxidoreductase 2-alkenal reductase [Rhizophagus clarus]|uniref:NADPH-dependent oxidoreductase 2-alkenal reductase n=1 Tax=Rhizophagus clarus TaxID=94130 RepID=A0A8H3QBF2_9GLOM|nr:NADPH-dependent oxidoreductase 2-alkenal reductase [Rhizophagus clarus]
MTVVTNKGVILKAIPEEIPNVDEHFELTHRTIDIKNLNLGENEIFLRNLYLSLDPYIRFTLKKPDLDHIKVDTPIANKVPVGQVISGLGVSEVVKTNNPNYKIGDLVYGPIGWEEYSHIKSDVAPTFSPVNKELLNDIPLNYHASFLRMGGLTSYASLMAIGKPKEGETIYISAAAGSTGQLVGQIAKIKGLKVIGSTGSDEKVDFLLNELKFDAAFNYKKVDLDKTLSEYCPNGIDIYYENVGGETLEIVLNHCNQFARIVVCGMISQYNITNPKKKYGVKTLENIFLKSISMQGFLVMEYLGTDIQKEFEKDIVEWIKSDKIFYKENMIDGIENTAKGFVDIFNGVVLKAYPKGMPKVDEYFEFENLNLGENEFVLRNLYLFLDPYVRLTLKEPEPEREQPINKAPSRKLVQIGQIIVGAGVSEVIKTNNPNFKVGDLGGLASYASLKYIGKPKEGETIFISAAAGFVGQLVGQIAKIKGMKVVGSAGSDEEVDYLLNELKFDAAFNYKKVDLDEIFTMKTLVERLLKSKREKYGVKTLDNIYTKRLCMQGFIVTDYIGTDVKKEYEKDIIEWIKSEKIIYKETIIDGIENVAKGFVDMLSGKNIGKYVVKLADY